MTVFKYYFKVLKSLLPMVFMYTVIFLFFAVIATTSSKTEVSNFTSMKPSIAVINHDSDSELIQTFTSYAEKYAKIVTLEEEEEGLRDALYNRVVSYILIIPEDFTKNFFAGVDPKIETMKIPDSYDSIYAEMLFDRFFDIGTIYTKAGMNEEEITFHIMNDLEKEGDVVIANQKQVNGLENVNSFFNFSNYTFLATIICVIGTIMNIFRDPNIKKRNLSSPSSYRKINFELLLGNMCFTLVVWLFYIISSFVLFGEAMMTIQGGLYAMNSFIFVIMSFLLAFLVANLFRNVEVTNMVANVVSLGSSFICGGFVPQAMLGSFVLGVAHLFPSYWFITNNNLILELTTFTSTTLLPIFINMGIILLFGFVFYLCSSLITRFTRKEG